MQSFDTPEPISLRLHLDAGTVQIVAGDVTTTTVDLRPVDDDDSDGWQKVEHSQVELDSGVLVIRTPKRHRSGTGSGLRLRVSLPLDSRLVANVASANLHCSGRMAQVGVKSASGRVSVGEVTGDLSVSTASGGVEVMHAQSALSVQTASGDVEIVRSDGDLQVSAASGDIAVREAGGSVQARSASGNVEVGCASSGSLSVVSASGDVEVGVRAGTAVWLDLSSQSGRTSSELPVEHDASAQPCSLNVRVRTASGDITLRRAG